MKNWERSLEKFIAKWRDKKYVVGAIVCGSYITGGATNHSDLDIQIILDKNVDWRERGNEIIDDILIEYFANPVLQIQKYFEDDYNSRRKICIHMFVSGKILFDKTGKLTEIIKIAKDWDKKKLKRLIILQLRVVNIIFGISAIILKRYMKKIAMIFILYITTILKNYLKYIQIF